MITPFLSLVLAGYAAFIAAVFAVWMQDWLGGSAKS